MSATAGRFAKTVVLCGLVALTAQPAKALDLNVGDRIPAIPGEAIIVGNDGGLKRQAEVLDLGQVCHVNGWTKNWLLVRRIVADWTLMELVGPSPGDEPNIDYPSSIAAECPLGTETSRPVTEMKARLNEYAKQMEAEFIKSLPRPPATRQSEGASSQAGIEHVDTEVVANGARHRSSLDSGSRTATITAP